MTIHETAATAQEAVKGGARGLTPQGEAELIRRVTEAAADSTEREVERLVRRFDFGLVVKVAALLVGFTLAGFAGGYFLGREDVKVTERRVAAAFADGPGQAKQWLELMESNDIRAALAKCTGGQVTVTGGRRACSVPLWLDGARGTP
ncbi:hypothetical protein JL101_035770 (plasmid) [Skermanella rosea]|uniref:hypothetical protein n=1 Tax=Skermanella rosea TaxID=1817965 RepID=UPI0019321FBE|nr:hypothetical protein [Skermanella rosea]UEM08011.1 hypothetical protein JL101_035770 [Skermanella rosea]